MNQTRFLPNQIAQFGILLMANSGSAQVDIPPEYRPISDGHVDLSFCYIDGEWSAGLILDDGSNPTNDPEQNEADGSLIPSDFAPLLLRDQASPNGARRFTPVGNVDAFGNDFSFLGVSGESPNWVISNSPQPNVVFLGFGFCSDNDCASYIEQDDPRVPGNQAPWITFELVDVEYVGASPVPGEFSVYTFGSFGTLTKWMTSADGIDSSDVFVTLGHRHANFAFSQLGLYTIKLRVSCYEGPGKTNKVTSPEFNYRFAVGTYWSELVKSFPPKYWDQPQVIGATADPDGDKLANVLEIATGLNPNLMDATPYDATTQVGLPSAVLGSVPVFSFATWTDAAASQIAVKVLTSTGLDSWNTLSTGITSQPIGNDGKREVRTWSGTGNGPEFFRLEATLLPTISY